MAASGGSGETPASGVHDPDAPGTSGRRAARPVRPDDAPRRIRSTAERRRGRGSASV